MTGSIFKLNIFVKSSKWIKKMNIMISKQLQKLRCDILFWDYYCFLFMFITNSKYILKLLEPSTFACDTNLLYFAEYICNSNCYCKPWNYESVNFSSANLHVKTKLQVFISDEFGLMQKNFFSFKNPTGEMSFSLLQTHHWSRESFWEVFGLFWGTFDL